MLGVNEMGKRKSDYIFAPEKQKSNRGGCLLTALGMLVALVLAALLLNQAVNSRVALLEERVSVMGMDKTFEGFTVLHISDLHARARWQRYGAVAIPAEGQELSGRGDDGRHGWAAMATTSPCSR